MIKIQVFNQDGTGAGYTQESVFLDTDSIATIKANYSIVEIQDFTAKKTSFSETFRVPFSDTNDAFFLYAFDLSISPEGITDWNMYQKTRCVVYDNNVPVLNGYLKINNVYYTSNQYEVNIYGELGSLATDLGQKKLEQLNWNGEDGSVDYTHYTTRENVVDSWSATLENTSAVTLPDVLYPVVDYGEGWSADAINFMVTTNTAVANDCTDFDSWRPSIKLKSLIDMILEQNGYTYTSDFFATDYWTKIFLLLSPKGLVINNIFTENVGLFCALMCPQMNANEDFIDSGVYWDSTGTNNGLFNTGTEGSLYVPFFIEDSAFGNPPIESLCSSTGGVGDVTWGEDYLEVFNDGVAWSYTGSSNGANAFRYKCPAPSTQYQFQWKIKLKLYVRTSDTGGSANNQVEEWEENGYYFNVQLFLEIYRPSTDTTDQFFLEQMTVTTWAQFYNISTGASGSAYLGNIDGFDWTWEGQTTDIGSMDGYNFQTNDRISLRVQWGGLMDWTQIDNDKYLRIQYSRFKQNAVIPSIELKEVKLNQNMFDMTQIDMLKNVFERFNLVVVPTEDNPNHLTIEPYMDYMNDGETKDWSNKLITDKEIQLKPLHDFQAKRLKLHDNNEGTKWYDDYIATYPIRYGEFDFSGMKPMASEDEKVIKTIFDIVYPRKIPNAPDGMYIVQLFTTEENGDGGVTLKPYEYPPTLFFYNSFVDLEDDDGNTIFWTYKDVQDDAYTQYNSDQFPTISNFTGLGGTTYFVDSSDEELNFITNQYDIQEHYSVLNNGLNSPPTKNTFNLCWADYLNFVFSDRSRMLIANFNLTSKDIYEFKYNDNIFINGHIFFVNKIFNFTIGMEDTTKVELLRKTDDDIGDMMNNCGEIGINILAETQAVIIAQLTIDGSLTWGVTSEDQDCCLSNGGTNWIEQGVTGYCYYVWMMWDSMGMGGGHHQISTKSGAPVGLFNNKKIKSFGNKNT